MTGLLGVAIEATYTVSTDAWLERHVLVRRGHGCVSLIDGQYWLAGVDQTLRADRDELGMEGDLPLANNAKVTLTRLRLHHEDIESIDIKMPRLDGDFGIAVLVLPQQRLPRLRSRLVTRSSHDDSPVSARSVSELVFLSVTNQDAGGRPWSLIRHARISSGDGFGSVPGAQALDVVVKPEEYGCPVVDAEGEPIGILARLVGGQPSVLPIDVLDEVVRRATDRGAIDPVLV